MGITVEDAAGDSNNKYCFSSLISNRMKVFKMCKEPATGGA